MSRIESLTPQHAACIEEYSARWRHAPLCTDPADRPTAERAIRATYELHGLSPPATIVWCDSPVGVVIARELSLPLREILKSAIHGADSRSSKYILARNKPWPSNFRYVRSLLKSGALKNLSDAIQVELAQLTGAETWYWVRNALFEFFRRQADDVFNSIKPETKERIEEHVRQSLRDFSLNTTADDALTDLLDALRDNVQFHTRSRWDDDGWPSWPITPELERLGTCHFCHEVLGLCDQTEGLEPDWLFAQSAYCYLPGRDICWISERPSLLELDGSNRPHSRTGPAIAFRDGWEIHAVHGVTVPGYAISHPKNITVEAILMETNAERRRVLIDLFGVQRFLDGSGAKAISRDASGVLYRKILRGAEPLTMVHVLNSTPEPDGEMSRDQAIEAFGDAAIAAINAPADARFKDYFLEVPPRMKTAHDAVAWTFGMKGEDYRPDLQT